MIFPPPPGVSCRRSPVKKYPREILDVVAAVVLCTREVRIGMLFAQARQVMREYDAASSRPRETPGPQPREYEVTSSEPREYEAPSSEPREPETADAEPLAVSRD